METAEHHEYTACLRVFSLTKTFAELVALLGDPSGGHDLGDQVSPRLPGRTRMNSLWRLDSTVGRSQRLEQHLEQLVTFAEQRGAVLTQLRADADVDIFCGVFTSNNINGGLVLEPALAGRLHDLQIPVLIDVH